jgi:hypothetical protein
MFWLLRLLFTNALFIAFIIPSLALAQSTDNPWTDPLNLSHSGVTINPDVVVDSDGVVHGVWQDDLANYLYSQFDGNQWNTLEPIELNRLFRLPSPDTPVDPFQLMNHTGPNPLFIASPNRRVYAFWILPEGRVFVSNVENENFKDYAAWGSARPIASGAASFTATADARGELHVAFIRTRNDRTNPPGIYYITSMNNGGDWTVPVLLYESPYFRALDEGEASLSIATAGTDDGLRVYVAWDNRPRKQVLLAKSADGGASWEEPALIAGSVPNSGLAGPFNIKVGVAQRSVVLIWQNGQAGSACSQIYQSSSDGGTTWGDPQPMIKDLVGCSSSIGFLTGSTNSPTDLLYYLTETQDKIFLTAWNGLQWSQSQEQPVLSRFEEPEIYSDVLYGCRRAALSGKQLYIIGCDEGGGGDVWFMSRDLGSNSSWFAQQVWSELSQVTKDNLEIESIELVTTDDGLIHAFFNKPQDPAVYYTYWNGELWSRISQVLMLPDGEAGFPETAVGSGNQLFLIARSTKGAVYYSRASSGDAATESSWSTPVRLQIVHDGEVGSISVAANDSGIIYIAYSVPLNEKRGIYLIQSIDQGTTWSEPIQVFDGAAAGFDVVSTPSLLITGSGSLHVIWKEQSIQGEGVPQPLSLYYTQSEDGGQTFNEAKVIVEEPVAWREIVTDDKGNLHLLWQPQDDLTTVWDQASLDGGRSWELPRGLPTQGAAVAVMVDFVNKLHLINAGPNSLDHWLWDGSRWQSETPLSWPLSSQQESPVELLAAAVNKQGEMIVVLAKPTGESDVTEQTLLYSMRTLELPQKQIATEVSTTETLATPTLAASTSTPEGLLTPTSVVNSQSPSQEQVEPVEASNPLSQLTTALLPVALLLLGVLTIVLLRVAQSKDR